MIQSVRLTSGRLVGRLVVLSAIKGRDVTLPYSYRNTYLSYIFWVLLPGSLLLFHPNTFPISFLVIVLHLLFEIRAHAEETKNVDPPDPPLFLSP